VVQRRFAIALIALISVCLNFVFLIKIDRMKSNVKIDDLVSCDDKGFDFPKGIYLIYPLDGSACSSCIYSVCDFLKNFSNNKKVWIFLPEGDIRLPKGFEKVGNIIRYKRINKLARKKVFFIGKNKKILFCIDIELLIESPKKTLKSFGYTFRYIM